MIDEMSSGSLSAKGVIESWLMDHNEAEWSDGMIQVAVDVLRNKSTESNPNTVLALRKIHTYNSSILDSFFTRMFWTLTGRGDGLEKLRFLNSEIDSLVSSPSQATPTTEDDARSHFLLKFDTLFNATPKAMTVQEKSLIKAISRRMWDSANVQEKSNEAEKYEEYESLMKLYYQGGHFNFEENEGESFLQQLKEKIRFVDDKRNLGKDQLAARVSSHFVKFLGEQEHVHLAGQQIPETVFSEVILTEKNGEIIPGIRYDMYMEKDHIEDDGEKITPKKFFWIQTENNPDGPDWTSYLKHRSLDFVLYTFRKKLGFKDANVGPYGYGPGDKNPIIIRLKKA